jgi:hypothetical protein
MKGVNISDWFFLLYFILLQRYGQYRGGRLFHVLGIGFDIDLTLWRIGTSYNNDGTLMKGR